MDQLEKEMLEVLQNIDDDRITELENQGFSNDEASNIAMSEAWQRVTKGK
jgi:flagellar biosynthesis/type III secretory pathway chaperone